MDVTSLDAGEQRWAGPGALADVAALRTTGAQQVPAGPAVPRGAVVAPRSAVPVAAVLRCTGGSTPS
jgi:hypothetical protein